MEFSGLTSHLTVHAAKLAEAADGSLDVAVPTCPGWTVADLVHHVAAVYEHKIQCMELGQNPPPRTVEPTTPPLTRMRTALGNLLVEFNGRQAQDETYTWYGPDQTVGFWIRRMAHETVIHRADAEIAVGATPTPIDDELAVDGIDEMLRIFVDWSSKHWAAELGEALAQAGHDTFVVRADDHVWTVQVSEKTVDVTDGPGGGDETATISGTPSQVLLWLWRRSDADDIEVTGNEEAVARFRGLLGAFSG